MNPIQRLAKWIFRIRDLTEIEAEREYETIRHNVGMEIGLVFGTHNKARWTCSLLKRDTRDMCDIFSDSDDVNATMKSLIQHYRDSHLGGEQLSAIIYDNSLMTIGEDGGMYP